MYRHNVGRRGSDIHRSDQRPIAQYRALQQRVAMVHNSVHAAIDHPIASRPLLGQHQTHRVTSICRWLAPARANDQPAPMARSAWQPVSATSLGNWLQSNERLARLQRNGFYRRCRAGLHVLAPGTAVAAQRLDA